MEARDTSKLPAHPGRTRWTADEARAALEAQARSGQSVLAFARAHELVPQRLYHWKRRLAAESNGEGSRPQALHFLPVRVKGRSEQVEPDRPAALELIPGRPHRVLIHGDFDEVCLRRLLAVLVDEPC